MLKTNRKLPSPPRSVMAPCHGAPGVRRTPAAPTPAPVTPACNAGLEDVTVCSSTICFIDGQRGRLVYRGYDAIELAAQSTFEEVTYLLWHGHLPGQSALETFYDELSMQSALPWETIMMLRLLPAAAAPMGALRTAVSALGEWERCREHTGREATLATARRLLVLLPWLVTSHHRLRSGLEPIAPCAGRSIAWNFLYTLHGLPPADALVRALDAALILHADHELNASTFAARVTAATLTDVYSAVTSAIGALKGTLHGGANEQVMQMLQEIATPERAESWVRDALANHRKVPGFGHRVYRTDDPRATVLCQAAEQLSQRAGDLRWFEISREVERTMRSCSKVYPNVDFYSATCYTMLGIPPDLFTPVFACSRLAGWIAHILEQWEHNRLIRPRADYLGPSELSYTPLALREC